MTKPGPNVLTLQLPDEQWDKVAEFVNQRKKANRLRKGAFYGLISQPMTASGELKIWYIQGGARVRMERAVNRAAKEMNKKASHD